MAIKKNKKNSNKKYSNLKKSKKTSKKSSNKKNNFNKEFSEEIQEVEKWIIHRKNFFIKDCLPNRAEHLLVKKLIIKVV